MLKLPSDALVRKQQLVMLSSVQWYTWMDLKHHRYPRHYPMDFGFLMAELTVKTMAETWEQHYSGAFLGICII